MHSCNIYLVLEILCHTECLALRVDQDQTALWNNLIRLCTICQIVTKHFETFPNSKVILFQFDLLKTINLFGDIP